MNRLYWFHPGEYELGENEKFYSDMEARGWRLVKRGTYLSRFQRVEPSRARYRVEIYTGPFLAQPTMPEEQVAVFEDCGWEYVADHGWLHVFRAPEGSNAPEFYADPAQQAETLKKVRRGMWGSVVFTFLLIGAIAAFFAWQGTIGKSWAQLFKRFLQFPLTMIFYALWPICGIYQMLWDTWKISRTYRRLRKGIPLDHEPRKHRLLRNPILGQTFAVLSLVCLLVTGIQVLASRSEDMPPEPDGPYIMLSDIGYEGQQAKKLYGSDTGVTHSRSLLADYWETLEVVNIPAQNDRQVWMRQYVYRLRFPGMADRLARALMEDSVFARDRESFYALDVPGLDAAWATKGLELVAVKGNMVAYVEFLASGSGKDFDPLPICGALAERWEIEEGPD